METTGIKNKWNAILLGALVLGATASVAIVGAGGAKQSNGVPNAANASDANSVAIVGSKAQDDAPLLDTFDRATAMLGHDASKPADELPLLDTLDRATTLLRSYARAQTDDSTLLDRCDSA